MGNKYFAGNKGQYLFCDICGQACYIWEATKLGPETGRGGLIVCRNDADNIDHGLIPYKVTEDKSVSFTRINHTNISNGTAPIDIETATTLGA